MSQILIGVGSKALDTTGSLARMAFIACNSMFTELFSIAGIGTPQLIGLGYYIAGQSPSDPTVTPVSPGDPSNVAFGKIIANFAALFAVTGGTQQIISLGGGPGMIAGENSPVIGTGDPARVAWQKVNSNFTYLYTVL